MLGILPGLVVAALLSLVSLIQLLSRPSAGALARDPATGAWGRVDRHPDWQVPSGVVAARVDGPLFYGTRPSSRPACWRSSRTSTRSRRRSSSTSGASTDLDVQALDMLAELADRLESQGIELRLGGVHAPALELLRRRGLVPRLRAEPTLDDLLSTARPNH